MLLIFCKNELLKKLFVFSFYFLSYFFSGKNTRGGNVISLLLAKNSQLLKIDLFLSIVLKFVELPLLKSELLALAKS
jgi:hypothetical protein